MVASLIDPLLGEDDRVDGKQDSDVDAALLEKGSSFNDSKHLFQERTVDARGKTSFWQTTMNLVNILIG